MAPSRLSLVFVLLLVLPMVLAVPTFQTSTNPTELTVIYPKTPAFVAGEEAEIYVHVFNASGVSLTNATTTCTIHFYAANGTHDFKLPMAWDGTEWEVEVNGSYMTLGSHQYTIFCASGGTGGFSSGSILVTLDGTDMGGADALPAVLVALIPLLFGFLVVFGSSLFDPEEHPVLRIFSHVLSFVSVLGSLWLGALVVLKFYNWTAFTTPIGTFSWIVGLLIFAVVAYWLVYVFYKIIEAVKEKKESRLNA